MELTLDTPKNVAGVVYGLSCHEKVDGYQDLSIKGLSIRTISGVWFEKECLTTTTTSSSSQCGSRFRGV